MAIRRDVRRYGDATTSDFPTMGDTAAHVDNASGAPSPNTVVFPRDSSAITASSPGPAPGHRMAMLISGSTSGPRLGDLTAHAVARAARYASARAAAGQASTAGLDAEYLAAVLGSDLRPRGAAGRP
jgi:hypothetical protein